MADTNDSSVNREKAPNRIRFKHRFEYAVLRLFGLPFRWLPYPFALGIAAGLARFGYHVLRWRVPEARKRVRQVFPEIGEKELRRTVYISFRNMCFMAVDSEKISRLNLRFIRRYMELDQALAKAKNVLGEPPRGAIFAMPHMGSWDICGVTSGLLGFEPFFISRSQKNPLVTKYIFDQRRSLGADLIDRADPRLLQETIKRLKANKHLCMTVDVRNREPGPTFEFLGKPAHLVQGTGMLSRMANVPVIPFSVQRIGWSRLVWRVGETIYPDPEVKRRDDVNRIMQEVLNQFTEIILQAPDQYFWFNSRWVLEPFQKTQGTAST